MLTDHPYTRYNDSYRLVGWIELFDSEMGRWLLSTRGWGYQNGEGGGAGDGLGNGYCEGCPMWCDDVIGELPPQYTDQHLQNWIYSESTSDP